MSTRLRDVLFRELAELRYDPTDKRIRAVLGGQTVVDSTRALLVWEPRRVVPSYAFPVEDVDAELAPADGHGASAAEGVPLSGRRVLDPRTPFAVHTAEGRPVTI